MEERKLKKINRKLSCNLTKKDVLVKPDKYERLLNYYGDEDKVRSRFLCAEAEKQTRNPEASFWIPFCIDVKNFEREAKRIIAPFKNTKRMQQDFVAMNSLMVELYKKYKIPTSVTKYTESTDQKGRYINGVVVVIPFYGELKIVADYEKEKE